MGKTSGKTTPRERIVVVANRLPVHRARQGGTGPWKESPGGLATALIPIVRRTRALWLGWTGSTGKVVRPFSHNGIQISPLRISASEADAYYDGFSNRTIWPLYHDAIRTPEFHREWWPLYVEVNRRFAQKAASLLRPHDLVWVNDYHLQLVPRFLRELRPDVRTGFFLHVPFPPNELFAYLPWRREILEGLLGADLVGFQTTAGAQNFVRCAKEYTTADGTGMTLHFGGRTIHAGSFPVSVDAGWFGETADSPLTVRRANEIRQNLGRNRKLILSVDRLDYTKGIDARLRAFGDLLQRRKASVNDCVLVQIAVPSRELLGEYGEIRSRVEQLVGRINGEHSVPGRVAVHFFRRSFPREELSAYYRTADVMLVTPFRDGMNLVAKEYVASRTNHTGVLILSEFAGAARELRQAILVNPYDIDGMTNALHTALHMEPRDARMRMAFMRSTVRRHDVYHWANEFLRELRRGTAR